MTNTISKFLANHKRLCPANIGKNCTCELYKARAELERLIDRDLQLIHYEIADDPELQKRLDEIVNTHANS